MSLVYNKGVQFLVIVIVYNTSIRYLVIIAGLYQASISGECSWLIIRASGNGIFSVIDV